MFAELPEQLKRTVREYLMADDFISAKRVHDDWKAQQENTNLRPLDWQLCSDYR